MITLTNSQFDCLSDPEVPGEDYSDQDLAIYLTRLQLVGVDCRTTLQELKNVLQVQGATITDVLVRKKEESKGFFDRLF